MESTSVDTTHCPTCGAKLLGRWERISKGLANTLVLLKQSVLYHGKNSIHLMDDMTLTKSQYNNFQKLRYHGLAVPCVGDSGKWLLTRRGNQFLKGEIELPRGVLIFRNKIRQKKSEMVSFEQIWKEQSPYWMKRENYKYESTGIEYPDIVTIDYEPIKFITFDKNGQGTINFDEV